MQAILTAGTQTACEWALVIEDDVLLPWVLDWASLRDSLPVGWGAAQLYWQMVRVQMQSLLSHFFSHSHPRATLWQGPRGRAADDEFGVRWPLPPCGWCWADGEEDSCWAAQGAEGG